MLPQILLLLLECCPVSSSSFVSFSFVSFWKRHIPLLAGLTSFLHTSGRTKLSLRTFSLSHQLLFFLPISFFVFAGSMQYSSPQLLYENMPNSQPFKTHPSGITCQGVPSVPLPLFAPSRLMPLFGAPQPLPTAIAVLTTLC